MVRRSIRQLLIKTLANSLRKDIIGIVAEHLLGEISDTSSTDCESEDEYNSEDKEIVIDVVVV